MKQLSGYFNIQVRPSMLVHAASGSCAAERVFLVHKFHVEVGASLVVFCMYGVNS